MEEKRENIVSHAMRSGLVLGGLTALLNILSWINSSYSMLQVVFSLLLCFITFFCIFFFTKQYIQDNLDGKVTYLSALFYGWYMMFFAAMVFATSTFVFFHFCPGVLERLLSGAVEIMEIAGEGVKNSDLVVKMIKNYTARDLAMSVLWGYSFVGFFIILWTSIFIYVMGGRPQKKQ